MALNLNALQRPKTGLDLTALGGERTDEFGLPRAEIRARPPEVPFDATKLGIFVNTLRGLPKAAKDLFFPTRGFTEEEIKSARPTFTQKALSVPKIAAEFSSAIGGALGSSPTSRAAEFSQTRLGGKLADIGERITEFGTPKNVEEAAAMRFADVVTAIPVGSIKVSTTAAQAIARTKNLKTIAGLLKKELPSFTDEVAENFGRLLVNIDNADDVQRILNKTEFALQEARKAGVVPERPTLPEIFTPTTPKTAPQQAVRAVDESLFQEARKYKTAEEFANNVGAIRDNFDWSYLDEMKARRAAGESYSHSDFNYLSKIEAAKRGKESRTFYRAGSIGKDGDIWLTPQEAGATQYGSAGGTKVGEYKVATKNPLILQDVESIEKILGKKLASESNFTNSPTQKQAVIDYAKKNGYDSVLMPDSFPDGAAGMESLVVWDKNLVKTKSQLTDIWERATGRPPSKQLQTTAKGQAQTPRPVPPDTSPVPDSLSSTLAPTGEGRKYKTAEEFVKAQGTSNLYNVGDSFEMGKIIENPFKEGLPSAKKVQEINRYLQANKDKYNPKYVKFYHGTAKGLPIEEKGLLPTSTTRRKSYQSESGYVYLANTPERAKTFGDLGNMSNSDVYEVVVPVNKLLPDLDQLNNLRSTGEKIGNTLGDSIVYGGGVRIKGKIEPYAVRKLPENTKTKSQLTDIWERATGRPPSKQLQTTAKGQAQTPRPVPPDTSPVPDSLSSTLAPTGEGRNLPAVIQGETFTLGTTKTSQPSTRSLRQDLRAEIKATKQEMKNAKVAAEKAAKLEAKEQKVRTEAMEKINRFRGSTDNIIASLKSRNLSDEDIANIVLEDGTKLIDTAKVKRNADGSLAAVIRKDELEALKANYADEVPKQKWEKRSVLVDGARVPIKAVRSIELPYLWFERKGLNAIYDPIIQAGRDSEALKHSFVQRFKDAGLFKEGGWFTADRFNLSSSEAKHIGQYYLSRQGKGYKVALTDLSDKERKFVEIFDGIIDETEPRFFETAKKNGRTPNKVENYAPIMTSKDFKLVDEGGAMDWLFRNHPSFSALKERVDNVPIKLYETDYREVAARWLDGITDFLTYGETTPKIKYLINSDEFKNIVKETDWQFISNWLRDVTTLEKPTTYLGQAGSTVSRFLRKGVAVGSLGLNYASVLKQALTQIPITLIEKAPPKLRSQYARQFGINVADLPALTKRTGDIALKDLQGKIGRIFTGALTKFDKINAQASLNALLDKEYSKLLKEGVDITPEAQKLIEKRAQDALDMWYGGFFKGQRPEAFRKELFNFILMFTYPLTSQLNGFVRSILNAQGIKKASKIAEVIVSAVAIAYMEQTIQNLSPQWSDEKEMTKDVLQSLAGNIPLVGDLTYALLNEQEIQVSPIIGNVNNVLRKLGQEEGAGWAVAETFGLPKQARRIKEGLEIMEEGGVTDSNGKMLAPVQDTMELVRSFLRGKYGSLAAQDWIRNIGEKSADRRWFVPQVEFLQNGDYERKAQLYRQFSRSEQRELRSFLSDGQQKKLDKALGETGVARPINRRSLEEIFR